MPPCPSCGNDHGRNALRSGSYWYAACDRCGLLRLEPLPDRDATIALYGADYFSAASPGGYIDYLGDEKVHRRNARRHLVRLQGLGRPGSLVEIGSAAGFLLDEARLAGWQVHGVEVSPQMVRQSVDRFGLSVVDDISKLALAPRSVDVVLANQVVEHLVQPLETLVAARALLRPGGFLGIETWDIGSPVARLMKSKWQQITPPHVIWLWDRRQLEALVSNAGFGQISIRPSMKWVSLRTILGQLGKGNLAKRLSHAMGVPYAFGDLVTLTARAK